MFEFTPEPGDEVETPSPDEPGETAALNEDVVSEVKAFRFTPSPAAASIIETAVDNTGLSRVDIINIALILMQNATAPELKGAIAEIINAKAAALFNSLK